MSYIRRKISLTSRTYDLKVFFSVVTRLSSHLHGTNVGEGIPGNPTIFAGFKTGLEALVLALANSIRIVVGSSGSKRTPCDR